MNANLNELLEYIDEVNNLIKKMEGDDYDDDYDCIISLRKGQDLIIKNLIENIKKEELTQEKEYKYNMIIGENLECLKRHQVSFNEVANKLKKDLQSKNCIESNIIDIMKNLEHIGNIFDSLYCTYNKRTNIQ